MPKQAAVKINPDLFDSIDMAVETVKDEFGDKRFKSRREFIDAAVRDFLRSIKISEPQACETRGDLPSTQVNS